MSSTDSQRASITKNTPSVVTSFAKNPLTTTFTRPKSCDGIYLSGFLAMVDVSSSCLPDGFKTDAYFSPGLICPSGYISACHDTTGVKSITTVTCCPTLKDPNVSLGCVTTSTLTDSWSTLFCTWIGPESSDSTLPVTTSDRGVTSVKNLGFHSPGGLNAFGIRMVYEASDLSTETKTTATPTGSASQSSGGAATSNPPSDTSNSGGLSTGAKVAIGVVIPIIALAALLGAFFWWRRRKHHYQVQPQTEGKPQPQPQPRAELHGTHLNELMAHSNDPVELPASNPGDHPDPGKAASSARWA
ncbi:transmembrane alpha-helix domain-containing protein [Pochonia chlamydosporia 170]|uniref:Transmembrane alpha-helix domain-containing protein n=1 Tax=Pochonia chlamydosporia 170 TaxID=1380566 RepID=A0A179FXL1_METCM|nr:transmembrane alpha-helix domain-containing protein [Pochonia chlamydosporia 170]OAQ69920.1 transmembrane alpha-helix domain-containing protein [Pochonia chlamydosporia 170]